MGLIQRPDEIQRVIERQVADGRAVSPAAFLEEVVMRFVDEAGAEEHELRLAVDTGSSDIDAGRYTTVATPQDERHLQDGFAARLLGRLPAEG